jgi:predicted GNAT family acetyltransferase
MKKKISIKNKKFLYFLLLKKDFVIMLKNEKILKSFLKIMKQSRGVYFKLKHLQYQKKNIIYSLITNAEMTDIITISMLNKNRIENVYTNIKYRSQGFCKINIKKIISYTNYKKLYLYVDIHNLNAISCYEKSGFIIIGKNNNTYKMWFQTHIR